MKISVVTTLYRSRLFLDQFITEAQSVLNELHYDEFELIFVNDGSPDDSLQYLIERKKDIPQMKIVDLSRNFGHHYAISAGLDLADGDLIFLIDCDLEVSPLVLKEFKTALDQSGADVVYGIQKLRKGAFMERVLGGVFWKAFNLLSDTKVPANVITERLMKRTYVDALRTMGDKNLFLGGMMYWVGFNQVAMEVVKKQRQGKSTYSFSKRLNLIVEAITSFSEKPLKLVFKMGIFITSVTVALILFLIIRKILFPETLLIGFTSLIVIMLFSLGVITSIIGIVGIYISRIFKQTQNRPNYIIKNKY